MSRTRFINMLQKGSEMLMSDLEFEVEKSMQSRKLVDLAQWSALTSAEQRVLGALFHKYAGQTFSSLLPSEVWAKEGLSGAEAKLAFAMLRRKQWIKSVHKSWGECSFHIPECHLATLTLSYTSRVDRIVEPMVGSVRRVIKEGKPHIAGELLHLLAWIDREGLPVTGKGTIHKRTVQKLSTLTIMSPEDFEPLEITYDHKALYPVHVVILLDLLLCLNLVQQTDRGFEIRQDKLQQWIKLSWFEMHGEVFRVCMGRYGASGSEMQHSRYQLAVLTPGVNQWFRVLCGGGNSGFQGWLHALAGWGFGEVGENENGEAAFRWLIDPAEFLNRRVDCGVYHVDRLHKQGEIHYGKFYVQPDFEVMVPPDVPAEVCWRLEQYCERITRDQMSIYRLTKARAETAAASGVKWEGIADFLQRHGQGGLPSQVFVTLKDWATVGENVQDKQDNLVVAENTDQPEQRKRERNKGPTRNSPFFYNDENQGLLQFPFMPGMTVDYDEDESDYDAIEKSAWNQRKADVPETWHREWRKYHLSTERQIAMQAIEWQVKLGIQKGKDTFVLIPHQVEEQERWILEGWCILDPHETASRTEWRTFTPEDWDAMRLILPDDV
ncbi:helicase-associated domain-containing protein [Paenibacillus polysaccharolyticus]|uniref:helicase-associated domain-containing protein n=1 Tax=Paenibacillus polysaccharolyticus TaxID=582692 RepID=UPI00209FFB12|nr:helicase-associated domain-containing protein [Paenibacillus polysaccharolyticus]MCP1132829.1 helicase-associated domain-containing protein [Paenibacillus polysaccharolyticus]